MVVYVESHINNIAKIICSGHNEIEEEFPLEEIILVIRESLWFDYISDFFHDHKVLEPLLNVLHGGQVDFKTFTQKMLHKRITFSQKQ